MTFKIIETERNYCITYKNEIVLTVWFQNELEKLFDEEPYSFYSKEVAKEVADKLCELLNNENSVLYEEVKE